MKNLNNSKLVLLCLYVSAFLLPAVIHVCDVTFNSSWFFIAFNYHISSSLRVTVHRWHTLPFTSCLLHYILLSLSHRSNLSSLRRLLQSLHLSALPPSQLFLSLPSFLTPPFPLSFPPFLHPLILSFFLTHLIHRSEVTRACCSSAFLFWHTLSLRSSPVHHSSFLHPFPSFLVIPGRGFSVPKYVISWETKYW